MRVSIELPNNSSSLAVVVNFKRESDIKEGKNDIIITTNGLFTPMDGSVICLNEDGCWANISARTDEQKLTNNIRYDDDLSEIGLKEGVCNKLRRHEIMTVGQLVEKTEAQLLKIRNFSYGSLCAVKTALAKEGLCLRH